MSSLNTIDRYSQKKLKQDLAEIKADRIIKNNMNSNLSKSQARPQTTMSVRSSLDPATHRSTAVVPADDY